MATRHTLAALLLATFAGCSANTADKPHPATTDTTATATPPAPSPPDSMQQQGQQPPVAQLNPLIPPPDRPSTDWPEFDKLIGLMETAVKSTYDRKGIIDESDVPKIEAGMSALAASTKGNDARKIASEVSTRTIEEMKVMKRNLPSGGAVPPSIRIDLIRMPIGRLRDIAGSLPPEMQRPQILRIEWMLITLEQAQHYADAKFDEERRNKKP